MLTKLTRANQVTIPAYIKKKAGLKAEERLEIDWDEKRAEIIIKQLETRSLRELFKELDRLQEGRHFPKMTAEELDEDFDREILDEYRLS